MLIQDGNRLYLVSEDPVIQAKMRELDNEEIKLSLEPAETTKSKVQENISDINDKVEKAYNYRDMSSIMEMYRNVANNKNPVVRKNEAEALKKAIGRFLSTLREEKTDVRKKFVYLYKQLPDFVDTQYHQILQASGYIRFNDYLRETSDEMLNVEFMNLMQYLLKRVAS